MPRQPETLNRRILCYPNTQIEPNQQKSRRAWSGSSMILWFVMRGRKRFRLGKSDDLDYLFRIGWVTRQSQSKRRKKHRTSRGDMETRRRQRGKTGRNPPYRHQSPPTAFSASPRSPHLRVNKTPSGAQSYGMKRFRLGKSDDLDYLFRIGWVTPANRNQSEGKNTEPHAETRRRQRGKTGRNPPIMKRDQVKQNQ